MKNNICLGCGSILQTEDEKLPGYIKKHLLEKDTNEILCQRCFRLKHYRDIQDVEINHNEFVKILNNIANVNALVINVVDLFDLSGSIISGVHRYIGNNDILLVGNKRDVLPKSINNDKIKLWVKKIIKDYGFKVVDIALTSAEKGHGIDELLELIEKHRKGRDVYIVGCTNVGKSTLVNAIIKRKFENASDLITVSHFPGTTLGLIELPLDDKNNIIDTPGVINSHQYAFYLDKSSLKYILPKKEIKPKVYQLESKQTLFFAGLARMDYEKGDKTSFVCYFCNDIKVHRTKLENADRLFEKHIGELFIPPTSTEYEKLKPYRKTYFKTTENCDIVISGLGFISIKKPNLHITIHTPNDIGVFIRPSLW